MNQDQREAAVDHVSQLLQRDVLTLEQYQPLVDRILAATTDDELTAVLSSLPAIIDDDVLVISCDHGVVKEKPARLPPTTEIRNGHGVIHVDFSFATIDVADVDLEIENGRGVVKVILPNNVAVELVEHRSGGGVFKNAVKPRPPVPGEPRIHLRVSNDSGVVKVQRPPWWRRYR